MTSLKGFRDSYYELSGSASEVTRKLGFAGIAVIWIFKGEMPDKSIQLPSCLYVASILIVISLALDLLQYALGSLIWGVFFRSKEREGCKDDQELEASPWLNLPAAICFWIKIISMVIAFVFMLTFLIAHTFAK
jgi:hypothetical protein